MRFSEYLVYYQKRLGLKSATALYEHLGSENKIGIKLRNFIQIYSDERHPSVKVFLKLISQLPLDEYKNALNSFFVTAVESDESSHKLIDYLEKYLSIGVDKSTVNPWDKLSKVLVLTEKQLIYLIENPESSKFLDLLLLKETLSIKYFPNKITQIKELEKYGLLKISKKGEITKNYDGLKVPSALNSSGPLAIKGHKYIFTKLENYCSSEIIDTQKIRYSIQCIKREHLPIVISQIENTSEWIRSLAVTQVDEDNIPFITVFFGRGLNWNNF